MNEERLPFHLDSIIALAIFAYAIGVAVLMNHARPRMRTLGVALAAVGCFAVTAGIVGLGLAGQFDEMRPHRYAIDPYKPVVMWVHAVLFFLAGCALAWLAAGQSRRTDELALGNRNEPVRYGRISRYYHWSIAVLVLALFPMGIFTTMLPYDVEYRQAFYVVHKSLGLTVFLLAGARVVWLLFSPAPGITTDLTGWQRTAAKVAHFALYFFLFAFPISGFVLGTSLGKLSHFYIWDFPLFWGEHEQSLSYARIAHKLFLPFVFYLIFLAHILGALKHQYMDGKPDYMRRMVT